MLANLSIQSVDLVVTNDVLLHEIARTSLLHALLFAQDGFPVDIGEYPDPNSCIAEELATPPLAQDVDHFDRR